MSDVFGPSHIESADCRASHRADAQKDRDQMALGFYITGKGFTQAKYDTTTAQLEEAGATAALDKSQQNPRRVGHAPALVGGE
jgi:hypothetical protein